MSYAAPMNLLSFHSRHVLESIDRGLKWSLVGSIAIHVVVLTAFINIRVTPTVEQPFDPYQVALVTLADIQAPPTPAPESEPLPTVQAREPERITDSLVSPLASVAVPAPREMEMAQQAVPEPPPQPQRVLELDVSEVQVAPLPAVQAREPERITDSLVSPLASVAVPALREMEVTQQAVPEPSSLPQPRALELEVPEGPVAPVPTVQAREPERITDSLVSPLASVAVPAPREMEVPEQVARKPIPLPEPLALELPAPQVQAPPPPPPLASDSPRIQAKPRSSITKPALLAQTLQQAVETIDVPKMQQERPQESSAHGAVSPSPNRVQKKHPTRTPDPSSSMTLPSQAPRLAAVAPLSQKDEAAVHSPKPDRVVASVKQTIQSVRIPEFKHPQVAPAVSEEVPLIPEPLPKNPAEAEAREQASSRPDRNPIASLTIPELKSLGAHQLDSRQTKSGTQETLTTLHVAGSSSERNAYWKQVWRKIDQKWIALPVDVQQQEPLQVVLGIRVEKTGQVKEQMLTVVQTSGNAYFDSVAKRAVVAASPLPPFPPTMTDPYEDFKFGFTVGLKK